MHSLRFWCKISAFLPNQALRNPCWKLTAFITLSKICVSVRKTSGGIFDYANKNERLQEVELELSEPTVWNEPDRAQALGRERASLETVVGTIDDMTSGLTDLQDLLQMAVDEDDEDTVNVVQSDLETLEKRLAELEFRRMF